MADQIAPMGTAGPGLAPWFASFDVLAVSPGRLRELVNRKFVVTSRWSEPGLRGFAGRPVLTAWVPGVRGVVGAVAYTSYRGWEVELEIQGDCVGLEIDEIMPRVPLAAFLRATAPVSGPVPLDGLPQEAANDPS